MSVQIFMSILVVKQRSIESFSLRRKVVQHCKQGSQLDTGDLNDHMLWLRYGLSHMLPRVHTRRELPYLRAQSA